MLTRLFAILGLCATLAAAPQPAAAQDTLTVFAAASMRNALDDVDAAFTKATGVKVTASYAASSALAKQIAQGAPADVLSRPTSSGWIFSNSRSWLQPARASICSAIRLVLIAPKNSKLDHVKIGKGFDIAKLAGKGRIAVADTKAVPAGLYAKAALTSLGAWTAAEPKLAQAENVRATLAYVARGETPLGIVYATDAKIEPKVKIIGVFPVGSHPAITYPVAGLAGEQERTGRALSAFPADVGRQDDLREIRLQLPGAAESIVSVLELTSQDWTAIASLAADRRGGDGGGAAFRHRHRPAAGAQGFLGQVAGRRARTPAAGAAAGGDRLSAAHHPRPQAPVGAFLADHFGIVFAFRWTGAVISCGVMAFPLMVRAIRLSIEAIDRRLEDAAATLGANRIWSFATVTLPLALPGIIAGAMLRFCPRARRIRRHHHFCLQHPGRDANHLGSNLFADPGTGRRRGRAPARRGRGHHLAGGAGAVRVACPPRHRAAAWGVTC